MRIRGTLLVGVAVLLLGAGAQPAAALRALPSYTADPLDSPAPQAQTDQGPGGRFGQTMDVLGDIDGDGVNDVAITANVQTIGAFAGAGRAWIFSGRTRRVLRTLEHPDPQTFSLFGTSTVALGDVDGGGAPDVAIGAALQDVYTGAGPQCGANEPNGCNEDQGRVYVFSGEDGSLIRAVDDPSPQPGAHFGGFRNAIGTNDLNGDGVRDFVEVAQGQIFGLCDADNNAQTPPEPCPDVGAAFILSGKDGSLLHRLDIADPPAPFIGFAQGTTNPGDVTGDGADDVVIGATNLSRAYLFNGKTGALVRKLISPQPPENGGGFGFGLGSGVDPGDVNGDGVRDIYVPAPGEDVGGVDGVGRVYLVSGADGSIIRTLEDPHPTETGSFGFNHASAGDLNGDGLSDLLIMRFVFGNPDTPGGAAYVFDPKSRAVLATLPGMRPDGPGSSLASPGDINGDGYPDYFLGGPGIKVGTHEGQGQVIVELSKAPVGGLGSASTPAGAPFPGCPALTANVIRGTAAANSISGTARADRIFAGAGNDSVNALAGDDCVDLGAGADRGQGDAGEDLLLGGLGDDSLFGSAGADRLHGDAGADRISGQGGRDRISGGSGADRISGGSSGDRMGGDRGRDRISGGSGNDRISGGSGNDRLRGGTGRDRISGGSGADRIVVNDHRRDRIRCGSGRDRVVADRIDRVAASCERIRRR